MGRRTKEEWHFSRYRRCFRVHDLTRLISDPQSQVGTRTILFFFFFFFIMSIFLGAFVGASGLSPAWNCSLARDLRLRYWANLGQGRRYMRMFCIQAFRRPPEKNKVCSKSLLVVNLQNSLIGDIKRVISSLGATFSCFKWNRYLIYIN